MHKKKVTTQISLGNPVAPTSKKGPGSLGSGIIRSGGGGGIRQFVQGGTGGKRKVGEKKKIILTFTKEGDNMDRKKKTR